jgi:hypothetical protein
MADAGERVARYEHSVRVVTAFFAVLVGFGLKQVLDNRPFYGATESPFGDYKWLCFFLISSLFLRFHLGSSNHLWYEYVRLKPGASEVTWFELMKDFSFLTLFGILALVACYSPSVVGLLYRLSIWLAVGIVWSLVPTATAKGETKPRADWNFWLPLNAATFALTWIAAVLWTRAPECGIKFLYVLVAAYIVGLAADFLLQVHVLGEDIKYGAPDWRYPFIEWKQKRWRRAWNYGWLIVCICLIVWALVLHLSEP